MLDHMIFNEWAELWIQATGKYHPVSVKDEMIL